MIFKLPDEVMSAQDLMTITGEVREYARWFLHESIKKRIHSRKHSLAPSLSPAASRLLHDWMSSEPTNKRGFDGLIRILENYPKKARTITITLPAPPTNQIKLTLVNWCRKNIAGNILVRFQFNATILGGMVIQVGSHVFDWSFKRQILATRETFPEVLRRV